MKTNLVIDLTITIIFFLVLISFSGCRTINEIIWYSNDYNIYNLIVSKQYEKAYSESLSNLDMANRIFGNSHYNSAIAMEYLAIVCMLQGKLDEAGFYLNKSEEILENFNDRMRTCIIVDKAILNELKGDINKANIFYREAISVTTTRYKTVDKKLLAAELTAWLDKYNTLNFKVIMEPVRREIEILEN